MKLQLLSIFAYMTLARKTSFTEEFGKGIKSADAINSTRMAKKADPSNN